MITQLWKGIYIGVVIGMLVMLFFLLVAASYDVEVLDVYDGDTFTVRYDLDWGLSRTAKVRLMEVNTPERRGDEKELGLRVRGEVEGLLASCANSGPIRASYEGQEKFGRDLVYMTCADGTDVGMWITERGYNKYACDRWDGMKWSGRYDDIVECGDGASG